MKYISCAILATLAASACANETQVAEPSIYRAETQVARKYRIEKLPSLGGTSRGMAINKRGMVAGWSTLADGTRRAAVWRNGQVTSLGSLGGTGTSSTVPWPGLSDNGIVVGITHTAEVDSLDEAWACELGGFLPQTTNLICRGFVYHEGVMRELPALGGNHSFAAGVNNRGQVVGWAETPVHDSTCVDAQVLQFRAVLWKAGPNQITTRELGPYPGESTSAATAINNRGEAVGISGACDQGVGRFSATHAVLWDRDGGVTEIPNLGGTTWHTPMDINDQGDVVGFSNPPGAGDPEGEFIAHAFLWNRGSAVAIDLGTLGDDANSEAFALNSRGQVVGISFGGSSGARAFLYENGNLKDLNAILAAGGPDIFLSAQDINDAGRITGRVLDHETGQTMTFIATPGRGRP